MQRRRFVQSAALASAAAAGAVRADHHERQAPGASGKPFALDYAPHFGMFDQTAGQDLLDQLTFMHDIGFRSLEDNGMPGRDAVTQAKIGDKLDELGMRMGVFVADAQWDGFSMSSGKAGDREAAVAKMREMVEVAKRCRARWMTVVPGLINQRIEPDYQTANLIETLKVLSGVLEPHGLAMVLEPLNHWTNHPGLFLRKIPQAYLICRAVGSPACKILFDVYHQQIQEGNLIPNMDLAWEEVAYVQVGDNPGRKEPTTGEINYANVFAHLKGKGYKGVVGMEHGNSKPGKAGEQAVIDAYRQVDPVGVDAES